MSETSTTTPTTTSTISDDQCNQLMDSLLNYVRDYHLKKFDPLYLRDKQTINYNQYVSVTINQCIIFGATSFHRSSPAIELRPQHYRRDRHTFHVGCDIQVRDLRANINFDAKIGLPKYRYNPRLKTCCVSVNRFTFRVEWSLNLHRQTIRATDVHLIDNDRVQCVSTGFRWPVNRTVETLIRKNCELFLADNRRELESMARQAINDWFAPTFGELFDSRSVVSDPTFRQIVDQLKHLSSK
ncbi:uncharacterized protein LOC128956944 [Oppia nitens]|uniref:uncharacterized protein LOC128956944 n=1 Tax=Oppia nitens TaxID=1686743 RepID=UPI0023DA932E|nr:uncharacterized protein LOC128956944 [Oppia nitens]